MIARIPYAILFGMPANLTPQYLEAEKRFKEAGSAEDKVVALQEMMAIIPKHKGTEKLRAELKRKMSAMRKESTQQKPASRKDFFLVEREGVRQLALVGAPNAGKSRLLASLTNSNPEVADYPFTTRAPAPGMMVYEDVKLQLIDLPPVSEVHMEYWVPQLVRNADAILWIVDLSDDDVLDQMESTMKILAEARIDLREAKTLIVGNKNDREGAPDRAEIVQEVYGGAFPIVVFSSNDPDADDIERFEERVYRFLDLVRVYTKTPGKKSESHDPFVLARGSTVVDLAGTIHRDLEENLKFAKVWGEGKIDGLMVARDYVLDDGDIVELHAA